MILYTNKLFTNHSREQKNDKAQSFDCIDFVLAQMKKKITRLCWYVLYFIEVQIYASNYVLEAPHSKTQVSSYKSSDSLQKLSVDGFSCAVRGFILGELLALLEIEVADAPSYS